MAAFSDIGIVSPAALILLFTAASCGLFFTLFSMRRYEFMAIVMVASTWVRSFFLKNEFVSVQEVESNVGSFVRILAVFFAGFVGYLVYARVRYDDREKMPPHLLCLGLFLLYALFTTTYSIVPSFTLARAFEFIMLYGFLLGLHAWASETSCIETIFSIVFWTAAVGLAANVISIPLLPSKAWFYLSPDRLQGIMGDPNQLGAFLMTAYPLLMWAYRKSTHASRKAFIVFLFGIALLLHALSGSRSTAFAAAIGFIVWHVALHQKGRALAIGAALALALIVVSSSLLPSLKRDTGEDSITNLTGRQEIWQISTAVLKQRPLHGFGYQVGGEIFNHTRLAASDTFLIDGSSPRFQLHNGYLSIAVGCGVIILVFWCLVLLLPFRAVWPLPASALRAMIVVLLVQGLILNFVEDSLSCGGRYLPTLVFWMAWIAAGRVPSLTDRAATQTETPFAAFSKIPAGKWQVLQPRAQKKAAYEH